MTRAAARADIYSNGATANAPTAGQLPILYTQVAGNAAQDRGLPGNGRGSWTCKCLWQMPAVAGIQQLSVWFQHQLH